MGRVISKAASVLGALLLAAGLLFVAQAVGKQEAYAADTDTTPMYRLYNKWSTEHLFTSSKSEYDNLVKKGWTGEGTAWLAPTSGDPVYRLYNKWSGDHHYTTSKSEYDKCVRDGWKGENVAFYSGGNQPVYRLFNPYVKSFFHHYTAGAAEQQKCIKAGWKDEKVGWYGYASNVYDSSNVEAVGNFVETWGKSLHALGLANDYASKFSGSSSAAEAYPHFWNLVNNFSDHMDYLTDALNVLDKNPALKSIYGSSFNKAGAVYANAAQEFVNVCTSCKTASQAWAARASIMRTYLAAANAFMQWDDIMTANTQSFLDAHK